MSENNTCERADDLGRLRLEMQALGLKNEQIDRIIGESLSGRAWVDLNAPQKDQAVNSLQRRIDFLRKLLIATSCHNCHR